MALEELAGRHRRPCAGLLGRGVIQGIEVARPAGEVVDAARAEGLLLVSAKGNSIRFVPPLIIEEQQVDELIGILKKVL